MTDQPLDMTVLDPRKIVWSNSMLGRIAECEKKFEYEYLDGFDAGGSRAMELGTLFHFVMAVQGWAKGHREGTLLVRPDNSNPRIPNVEGIHIDWEPKGLDIDGPVFNQTGTGNEPIKGYPLTVTGALEFLREVWSYRPEAEEDDLPAAVESLVKRYLYEHRENIKAEKVLLVEHRWEREHDGMTFTGTVDRLVEGPDGLVIARDHKTTVNPPASAYRLTDAQLHFYAWGIEGDFDIKIDAIEFDYAITKKPINIEWTKPTKKNPATRLYANIVKSDTIDIFSLHDSIKAKQAEIDSGAADLELKYTAAEIKANDDLETGATYTVRPTIDHEVVDEVLRKVLENPNPFFHRLLMPKNTAVIDDILAEAKVKIDQIVPRIQAGGAVRNVDWMNCNRCAFAEVCTGDRYGNDTELLRQEFGRREILLVGEVGGMSTNRSSHEIDVMIFLCEQATDALQRVEPAHNDDESETSLRESKAAVEKLLICLKADQERERDRMLTMLDPGPLPAQ